MPKKGPSSSEWREKLRAYARRELTFGRGQKPAKDSHWAGQIAKIEACPLFSAGLARRPCTCGYHVTVSSACYGAVLQLLLQQGNSTGTQRPSPTGGTVAKDVHHKFGHHQHKHRQEGNAGLQCQDVGHQQEDTGHQQQGCHQDGGFQPHPGGVPGADVQSLPGVKHPDAGAQQPPPTGAKDLCWKLGHRQEGDTGLQYQDVGHQQEDTGHQQQGCHQDGGFQPHPGGVPGADVRSLPGVKHPDAGCQHPLPAGVPGDVGIQQPGPSAGGTGVCHPPACIQPSVSSWSRASKKKKYQPKIVPRV